MDFYHSLPFAKLGTELGRWIRYWICWYRSWVSLVMFVMVISPFFLVSRVPAAVALLPLVFAILTVLPLKLSSVEQRLRSLEQVVTLQKQALSSQEKTLCQVTLDLTALQHSVSEQEASFERRISYVEQHEFERQQAILQVQRRTVALVGESLSRIESSAVAERLRFEALTRSDQN